MLARGDHDHVAAVVQVVERVARLRADAVHVALALEREQVRLGRGCRAVRVDGHHVAALLRVLLVHERQGDVERGPVALHGEAGFCEYRFANVEPEVFRVIRPRS